MSQQLDYEATKAALRAQVYGTAGVRRHLITRAWKWYGLATSVVVIGCAMVLTLWVTTGGSVTMVPSGDHNAAAAPLHGSTSGTDGTTTILGAPVRQVLLQPDGTVLLDAAGVPVVVTTPEAAAAAVARGFRLRPATTPEELTAPATPVAVITATPRAKPPAPSNGAGTPQPSQPPTNGGGTGTPPTGGATTDPTTPPTVPTTDQTPPSGPTTDPAPAPAPSPADPPPATDTAPAPAPAPDPTSDAAATVATESSTS